MSLALGISRAGLCILLACGLSLLLFLAIPGLRAANQVTIVGIVFALIIYFAGFHALDAIDRAVGGLNIWVFGVLAIAIAILPWGDELWIASRFASFCRDAGVYVVRHVDADGVFYKSMSGPSQPGPLASPSPELDKSGYQFVERRAGNSESRVSHLAKNNNRWMVSVLDAPRAKYFVIDQTIDLGYQLEKREAQLVDSTTGEILGRDTQIKRYSSIIEAPTVRLLGGGLTTCRAPLDQPHKEKRLGFIDSYVLNPTGLTPAQREERINQMYREDLVFRTEGR